ncbi:MAG: hypothetical protein LBU86_02135 [Oscillospiraceae bacterium]|jgi:carboxyl-terminal processing protease|nr:hypothetical protein [Oscillospiraceae bacterium]
MNKRVSLGFTLALMILVATLTFTATFDYVSGLVDDRVNNLRERESTQDKLSEIDREVRANYSGAIDETALLDSLARGYLSGIGDSYAAYYDARTYERRRRQEGSAADIGALIESGADGYLHVVEIYPESPAQSAGMLAGDLIVKMDDIDVTAENSAQMLSNISGEAATVVTLTVRSGNTDRVVELQRRVVATPVVYSKLLENNVGYIWIKQFNRDTQDQFKRERDRLVAAGALSIIFDVRDNSGESLEQTCRILDMLVPAGPIVSWVDKNGNVEVKFASDGYEINLPTVVLINENTASGAELFAQVLRDYDKARIVGVTSVGKGVAQEEIPLSDGSAILITVATLLTPGEVVFHEIGVRPDYEVTAENWAGMTQSRLSMDAADFVAFDAQLKKAAEVVVALHRTGEARQEQSEAESSEAPPPEPSLPQVAPPPVVSEPEESEPEESEPEESEPEESEPEEESEPGESQPEEEESQPEPEESQRQSQPDEEESEAEQDSSSGSGEDE